MQLRFSDIPEQVIPRFRGGEKEAILRMHTDSMNKIMYGRLEPGASIGLHTHETNSEIIYFISGTGKMLYDDVEEAILPGLCHYCPKGHTHSMINTSKEDLIFFAVVPEQ